MSIGICTEYFRDFAKTCALLLIFFGLPLIFMYNIAMGNGKSLFDTSVFHQLHSSKKNAYMPECADLLKLLLKRLIFLGKKETKNRPAICSTLFGLFYAQKSPDDDYDL